MKRRPERFLTTHVGSLIRPAPLQEFLRAKQAGKPYTLAWSFAGGGTMRRPTSLAAADEVIE